MTSVTRIAYASVRELGLWEKGFFAREANGRFLTHRDVEVPADSALPVVYFCGAHGMHSEFRMCVTLVKDFGRGGEPTCLKGSDRTKVFEKAYDAACDIYKVPNKDCEKIGRKDYASFCSGKNVYELTSGYTGKVHYEKATFGIEELEAAKSWLDQCSRFLQNKSSPKPLTPLSNKYVYDSYTDTSRKRVNSCGGFDF